MIDYFYPELNNPKYENQKKRFVNELLNPEEAALQDLKQAGNMQKPKNDVMPKIEGKFFTNDGR